MIAVSDSCALTVVTDRPLPASKGIELSGDHAEGRITTSETVFPADTSPGRTTRHTIGLAACIAFCVGTMIGGGVFTLSVYAVQIAGPAAIAAYALAGLVMLLSVLSFAAISARAKPGESGYTPLGEVLGPAGRFLAMWAFYLNAVVMNAFLLITFVEYLREYFLPSLHTQLVALLAIAVIALLNLGSTALVGRAELSLVSLKVTILFVLIGFGLAHIGNASFVPFAPSGAPSLLIATATLFTAYTGFNVVTNIAGSVRKPRRTVPMAMLLSVGIAGLVYVGVAAAVLASGETTLGPAGLGRVAGHLMGPWGQTLVAVAALVSTFSAMNANVLGASELMIRLAHAGDISPRLVRPTSRGGHPASSVLGGAALTAALMMLSWGNPLLIVQVANVSAIVGMVLVDVAAARLALEKWPGEGLRLPGGALIPALATLTALGQLPSLGLVSTAIALGGVVLGLVLFAARSKGAFAAERQALAFRIRELETPLARVLRRRHRFPAFAQDGRRDDRDG